MEHPRWKDGSELEANQGFPKQGHRRNLTVKCFFWGGSRNAIVMHSGHLEVKLKSVGIWKKKDLAICPSPLPHSFGEFSHPMPPSELPPVQDISRGAAEGCSPIALPAQHHNNSAFPSSAAPATSHPRVASIKRITEQNDGREGITGHYQPDPLLINYWSDI